MALTTVIAGILLILVGFVGYLATGRTSVTAMIPAFFGGPLLILGIVALKDQLRKHAMHVAVVLSLLGFVGAVVGLIMNLSSRGSGTSSLFQILMAIVCAVFVVLCVRSFIQARRSRLTEE
jgi:preprotein translocase subunit Sss1